MAGIEIKLNRAQVKQTMMALEDLTREIHGLKITVEDLANRVMLTQPKPRKQKATAAEQPVPVI
jgi:hypothetical protein